MRLFVDECITPDLVEALGVFGLDVIHANDAGLAGVSDVEWIGQVAAMGRMIVTLDGRMARRDGEIDELLRHGCVVVVINAKRLKRIGQLAIVMRHYDALERAWSSPVRPLKLVLGKATCREVTRFDGALRSERSAS